MGAAESSVMTMHRSVHGESGSRRDHGSCTRQHKSPTLHGARVEVLGEWTGAQGTEDLGVDGTLAAAQDSLGLQHCVRQEPSPIQCTGLIELNWSAANAQGSVDLQPFTRQKQGYQYMEHHTGP